MRKTQIIFILCLSVCSIAGGAWGQPAGEQPPQHSLMPGMMGPTGISGDQHYVYVMAAGKILEYDIAGMKLLRSVDLPKPDHPAECPPPKAMESGKLPPPPPPLPQGLWAGNDSLYVLAGPVVHIYSIPALTLKKTEELPKPELPQPGK